MAYGQHLGHKLAQMTDWPDATDDRYAQLAGDNDFTADNNFSEAPLMSSGLISSIILPSLITDDGQYFNDGSSSYPTGWTEDDAAGGSVQNNPQGFWRLNGSNSERTWQYSKQLSVAAESLTVFSLMFGPILFRDAGYTADLEYRFAIHADNAGSPDADIYSACALKWDSAAEQWVTYYEVKDGTSTQTSSEYAIASYPLPALFLRPVLSAGTYARGYVSSSPLALANATQMDNFGIDSTVWGTCHAVVSLDRTTGGSDFLYIGCMDRINTA